MNSVYIMLEDRLDALFKTKEEYSILEQMKGSSLVGRKYRPLFTYFQHLKSDQPRQGAFRIVRSVCVLYLLHIGKVLVSVGWGVLVLSVVR